MRWEKKYVKKYSIVLEFRQLNAAVELNFSHISTMNSYAWNLLMDKSGTHLIQGVKSLLLIWLKF